MKSPGFNLVGFVARRDDVALPRTAAVEFDLDFGGFELEPGRTAVNHDAHGRAVAFAPGRDCE